MNGADKRETTVAVMRLVVSFAVLVAFVSFVGWAFREPLTRFGGWFVARFGVAGIVAGSFLADGFHFPIPPQFYLLTGIAGGYGAAVALVAVLVGSELGGLAAFSVARRAGRAPWLAKRLEKPSALVERMMHRRGYLGLALTTLLPVSYCLLCFAGGAMRLPFRAYGVLAVMRVPRILLSYVVIALAWH